MTGTMPVSVEGGVEGSGTGRGSFGNVVSFSSSSSSSSSSSFCSGAEGSTSCADVCCLDKERFLALELGRLFAEAFDVLRRVVVRRGLVAFFCAFALGVGRSGGG